eukprot:gene2013-biopygen1981
MVRSAYAVGVMGGWSPTSTPDSVIGTRLLCWRRRMLTVWPHTGWLQCSCRSGVTWKERGYRVLSVRGYEMYPEVYSFSACFIALCGDIPSPLLAPFSI